MAKADFWDKAADRYARRPVQDEAAYAHTLERTRAYLGGTDRVLELGCGTGTTALKLADAAGHILATDLSAAMIRIARAKGADQGAENVEFAQAGADALPAGPFEAVLAFNLLHLLPDPDAALGQIAARLKPGGYFISKTVCLGDPGLALKYRALMGLVLPAMQALGKVPRFRKVSSDGLEAAIARAGFEIVEAGHHNAQPPSRFIVARKPV